MWLSMHLPSGWSSSAPLVSPMLPWSSSLKALSLQPPPLRFHLPMSYHLPSHYAPIEGSFLDAWLVLQVKHTEQKIEGPQVRESTQVCLSGPELAHLVLFSQFHPFPWECHGFAFLHSQVIFHCVHVTRFSYPSTWWRTSRLSSYPSCCRQSSDGHGHVRVSGRVQSPAGICLGRRSWVTWQF